MLPVSVCTACGTEEAAASGALSGAGSACTDAACCACAACCPSAITVCTAGMGAASSAASTSTALRAKMHSAANRAAASVKGRSCPGCRVGSGVRLRKGGTSFRHSIPLLYAGRGAK